MLLVIRYKVIAVLAFILLISTTNALGETEYPLVGCYSIVGKKKISLQVAQQGNNMYMAPSFEKNRSIINEQLLAHEMDRQELSKVGFKANEIDKFTSNIFLNHCSSCFIGVLQIKHGEEISSLKELSPIRLKKQSNYFAFLGITGTWVNKVDCPKK